MLIIQTENLRQNKFYRVTQKKGLFHDPRGVPTMKTQTKMNFIVSLKKRDYSMIPEGGSYNENPNQNKFWLVFLFLPTLKSKLLEWEEIKKPETYVSGFLLRRKRDSNPRTCYSQQFSRLPHSTALPFLQ
jgi:hypothetical protein